MCRSQVCWTSSKVDVESSRDRGFAGVLHPGLRRNWRRFIVALSVCVIWPAALDGHGLARAQAERPGAAVEPVQAAPEQGSAEALSKRYRFLEKYGLEPDPAQPWLVTQYQVAIRESRKQVVEKPQGAPDRMEWWTQTIYTERPAKVTNLGDVVDAVRRYDTYRQKGLIGAAAAKTPLFQGLTVWVHRSTAGPFPEILTLDNDRPLRDAEFDLMVNQVSAPPLTALLPTTPRRVGDTWRIPRAAAFYLFDALPDPDDYAFDATLREIKKAASGTNLVAIFGISGSVTLPDWPWLVNGEIHFAFEPPPAVAPAPGAGAAFETSSRSAARSSAKRSKEGVVEARGWITELRMAKVHERTEAEGDGRFKMTETDELWLARRPMTAVPTQPGQPPPAPLTIPDPPPTANETNSWVVYEAPAGKFHFRHPQVLTPPIGGEASPYEVHLRRSGPEGGGDRLDIMLQSKDARPEVQLAFQDPEHFKRAISQSWSQKKQEILHGPEGYLSGKEWDEPKRKVYRIEAGLKVPRTAEQDESRAFLDYYLVEFGRGQAIIFESWTDRDDHVKFRSEVEGVIKSFKFGPWKPGGPPATSPAAPAPPAR